MFNYRKNTIFSDEEDSESAVSNDLLETVGEPNINLEEPTMALKDGGNLKMRRQTST